MDCGSGRRRGLCRADRARVLRSQQRRIKESDARQRAFWAIIEDPFEQVSRFYALARSPSGVRSAWQGVLRMSGEGRLEIDVGSLEERSCDSFGDGLRIGLAGICVGP